MPSQRLNTNWNPYEPAVEPKSEARGDSAQPTESSKPGSSSPSASIWVAKVIQYCLVMLLAVPGLIAFQIAAMLLTPWATQGFAWLATGALWIPTAIALPITWREKRSVKRALLPAVLMGMAVTVSLFLLGLLLLVAAGPMDGGI